MAYVDRAVLAYQNDSNRLTVGHGDREPESGPASKAQDGG